MRRWLPIVLFLSTVVTRLIVFLLTRYTVDDAFITFRYAENIVAGNGFVYNLGEKVLGTSTPLFTLLLAGLKFVGLDVIPASLLISLFASGATAVLLFRWSEKIGLEKFSLLPSMIYIFFSRSVTADICGMETAFFTMLLFASFYLIDTDKFFAAVTCASLAAITRPEGMLILMVVFGAAVALKKVRASLLVIPILLIVVNWLLFSFIYFGSIVPNSVLAKQALYHDFWNFGFLGSLYFMLGLRTAFGWLLLGAALLGLVVCYRINKWTFIVLGFAFSYLIMLAAGNVHIFFWYPAPVYPLFFLGATIGIMFFLQWLVRRLRLAPFRVTILTRFACVAIVGLLLVTLGQRIPRLQSEISDYDAIHRAAAEYLVEHHEKGERVLAEDIGQLGYIFRENIIDRDGLVTPAVIPYNRGSRYWEFADSVDADWVFITAGTPTSVPILDSPDFQERYIESRQFGTTDKNIYHLFRKK